MSLKRILAEEAELEKEYFGTTSEPSSKEDLSKSEDKNVDDKETVDKTIVTEVTTDPLSEHKPDQDIKDLQDENTWEKRFKNYKASTDKTIANLRKDNVDLIGRMKTSNDRISELMKELSALKTNTKDPIEDIVTQQDIDNLGPEAIDFLKRASKKATETAVSPLHQELEKLKAKELVDLEKSSKERRAAAYDTFSKQLAKLVPDYKEIDVDKGFEEFMLANDPTTGDQRLKSFRIAEEYLDPFRVADYFNDYKASIQHKSKKEILEDKITPSGKASGTIPNNAKKDTFTVTEVNKFFDDIARGVYKNKRKDAEEIEARITQAYIDGKIIN